jgi:DNA mismatch repair protein MutS
MGDFYEMFLRDAEIAAPLLDIQLTTRDKAKENPIPMCGVPVHAADAHIKRLAELGYRVAICEQVEDPREAGGRRLVRREVVEVITPGLVGDPDGVAAERELALVALLPGRPCGMAVLDATTGSFRATQLDPPVGQPGLPGVILEELQRIGPREIVHPDPLDPFVESQLAALLPDASRTPLSLACFDATTAQSLPDGIAQAPGSAAAGTAAALFGYLRANQPFAATHTAKVTFYGLDDAMVLDAATCAHLELFRNSEDGSRARTLSERLDETSTALGARRLMRWIAYPLLDPQAIARRQEAVGFLLERDRPRARLREALTGVRDLERLFAKTARPTSTPRDLAGLRSSLAALPGVAASLANAEGDGLPGSNQERPPALAIPEAVPEIESLLRDALIDDPPNIARGSRGAGETGYIRDGFHSELDGLREAVVKGREWIAGLESQERERTGISTLKIRFHPVHGYSVEISKSNLRRVPDDFER